MDAIIRRLQRTRSNSGLHQPPGSGLCKAELDLPDLDVNFRLLTANVHGLLSHQAELEFHLADNEYSELVALTETWLNDSVSKIMVNGYVVVSRLDRKDGRQGGGIALLATSEMERSIVHIGDSKDFERSWHILHTNQGPILIAVWYRPPQYGEVASIKSLQAEWHEHSFRVSGTIVVGDMNVHNVLWLQHSSGNSPEGKELFNVCSRLGLVEKVRKPTRGLHLLDLFLTDIASGASCKVLPRVSDHNMVLGKVYLKVDRSHASAREFWNFEMADWDRLNRTFASTDWRVLFRNLDLDNAVDK